MTGELVDRTDLLDRIRAALVQGSVLLHGPAGIGKTAVLDALAEEAGSAGSRYSGAVRRRPSPNCRTSP
ncbi:ATP-binding protein [Kitasatospora cinereorecta]|uniref:ATP-binding protein n=1 Tax=Kitasatospora cinereorecta TaxID=285560 RepID=A0ABW0V2D8_9ACTN